MPESPKEFLKRGAPRLREERWCFTAWELTHPHDCRSQDQFVAYVDPDELWELDPWAHAPQFGVVVYRNGTVTDYWSNGDKGVPEGVRAYADGQEVLAKIVARNEDDEVTETWRDVLCRPENGRFVRFVSR